MLFLATQRYEERGAEYHPPLSLGTEGLVEALRVTTKENKERRPSERTRDALAVPLRIWGSKAHVLAGKEKGA